MSHSLSRIWIHGIWTTKNRDPYIAPAIERRIYRQLYTEFKDCGCTARIINGMPDHVHSLFLLNPQKCPADVIKQVKGGSSHWINQQPLLEHKFAWQTGYAAYSVSESQTERVYKYILNQKEHHKSKNYLEEYNDLMILHNLFSA
jgi:putative transposase